MPDFYEFFAGGGMARAGLGDGWRCRFANDFDRKKGQTYRLNWGSKELKIADVRAVTIKDLPGVADLIWGSFPCQDLSLAGAGAGLKGDRSGTFWPFWKILKALTADNRAPKLIVLENVCGTLTSHGGKDFAAICGALEETNYRFGAVVIDAALFVPQSRPRLFVIGVRNDLALGSELYNAQPAELWHTRALRAAYMKLAPKLKQKWVWWNLPFPATRNSTFADLIESDPVDVKWHTQAETSALLAMMSEINLAKVEAAKKSKRRQVGGIYKRTRRDDKGQKVQRAEIRFDDLAGCLRTPTGGSSRQLILVVEKGDVRSRLVSGRETARLMGLSDEYKLPTNYNEAYHLTGDGVVVPVVRHLAEHILERILLPSKTAKRAA